MDYMERAYPQGVDLGKILGFNVYRQEEIHADYARLRSDPIPMSLVKKYRFLGVGRQGREVDI